jgi:tetratricopeptide (TPR) repeat protein
VIVATLRELASALSKDLRPIEATRVLDDVLAMSRRLYGDDHPAVGDAYMSRAIGLDMQRRHAEAVDDLSHAVAIYRKAFGSDHPRTLRALRNEAVELDREGRYAEAGQVYEEVYATCLRTLGPEHPQTIEALRGLQDLRVDENRLDDARALARRITATYERLATRPDAEPDMLADYSDFLIEVDPADVRDPARAVAIAARAVEATKHQDWDALRSLGFARAATGDWNGAIASLEEALKLPEGVRSWTTEDKLVQVLDQHGPAAEEERFLLAHLDDERRVRGADDRYLAKTFRHLSHYYVRVGRPEEAERYARETLAQLLKTLPATHWEVGRAQGELGGLLVARGGYAEAESLLVQGFRIMEADPEVPASDLETARGDLVRLYRATSRPGDALAWSGRKFAPRAPSAH